MGWFGFGGSRERDDRDYAREDAHKVYKAERVDRRGPRSELREERPRRQDNAPRRGWR